MNNRANERVNVFLSKKKLIVGITGSLLFVVAGFFLFFKVADLQTRFIPIVVKVIGIVGILFFGATGIYGVKKLFDRVVGLAIDENGIFDNTNASSVGLIPWKDITGLRTEKVESTQFLLIYVSNPDDYFDRVRGFKKKFMQGNYKMYGTPLSITSGTLQIKFADLETLLQEKFNQYKKG